MEYIVGKAYKKLGIDQNFDLAKGASAFEERGIISYNGKKVCYATSQDAHDFFARNDDGKGRERFKLTHDIINAVIAMKQEYEEAVKQALEGFERDEEGNYPAEALEAAQAVENKPKAFFDAIAEDADLAKFIANGYWSNAFFNGDIAELKRVENLI